MICSTCNCSYLLPSTQTTFNGRKHKLLRGIENRHCFRIRHVPRADGLATSAFERQSEKRRKKNPTRSIWLFVCCSHLLLTSWKHQRLTSISYVHTGPLLYVAIIHEKASYIPKWHIASLRNIEELYTVFGLCVTQREWAKWKWYSNVF